MVPGGSLCMELPLALMNLPWGRVTSLGTNWGVPGGFSLPSSSLCLQDPGSPAGGIAPRDPAAGAAGICWAGKTGAVAQSHLGREKSPWDELGEGWKVQMHPEGNQEGRAWSHFSLRTGKVTSVPEALEQDWW